MPIRPLLPRGRAPRTPSSATLSKEAGRYYNDLILHGKERLIPWSKSPFYDQSTIEYRKLQKVRKQTSYDGVTSPEACVGLLMADQTKDIDESNNKETGEHPPVWLDLFYDLAWSSTFSNVTQNNTISGEESLSYAAFFVLVWWMWVSQVSYDIRFYSNDWVHRVCVFFQFCVFGALAAFTSGLDVMPFIESGNSGPAQRALDIINSVSQDQRMASDRAEQQSSKMSFLGISLAMGVSRVLLCLQYVRVWLYAQDKRDPAVTVKPLTMFISTGLWCSSIAMLLTQYTNDATQVANFVIWGIAIAIEVASHHFSPLATHLRSTRSLAPRLATLVTIISGEGLIVIIGTLWFGSPSPGFILGGLCAAFVAYFTFYLYFEGSRRRIRGNRRSLWIFLHLPYMICIVLFMEGIKSLLLYTVLCQSTEFMITQLLGFLEAARASDSTFATLNQTMDIFLTEIGMPWDDQKKLREVVATAMNNTATNQAAAFERAFTGGLYRSYVDHVAQAIERFGKVDLSPETKLIIAQYVRNDSMMAIGTMDADGSYSDLLGFGKVLAALIEPQVRGARWMSGFAGGSLIFLALIKITGCWPKGRYTWGSVVLCILNGTLQLSVLFFNAGSGEYDGLSSMETLWRWLDSFWVLLTLALSFLVQAIADHILLYFAVRSAERSLKQMYQPNINDLGQDSEDIAYDPPKTAGACLATTPMNYSPTPQAEEYDATEVSNSSISQRWSRRTSPSVIERQKSISFVSPHASLSSPQVTEGMSMPLDRIVALPGPGIDETQGCINGVYE